MTKSLESLRKTYLLGSLDVSDVAPNPCTQFEAWFEQIQATGSIEANAMVIATVDAAGKPSARTVLLKQVDEQGFVFYTNYESRKGHDIEVNPNVALVFYWPTLERQVRVNGVVEKVDSATSDEYFSSRPLGSQIGAIASPQSEVVPDRAWLESRFAEYEQDAEAGIERPEHWGGYRVVPEEFEFWQGRPNRVHDRIRYRRDGETWAIERLAP